MGVVLSHASRLPRLPCSRYSCPSLAPLCSEVLYLWSHLVENLCLCLCVCVCACVNIRTRAPVCHVVSCICSCALTLVRMSLHVQTFFFRNVLGSWICKSMRPRIKSAFILGKTRLAINELSYRWNMNAIITEWHFGIQKTSLTGSSNMRLVNDDWPLVPTNQSNGTQLTRTVSSTRCPVSSIILFYTYPKCSSY